MLAGKLRGGGDAVLAGHLDVEQRDVDVVRMCSRQDEVAATELRHDLDVVL